QTNRGSTSACAGWPHQVQHRIRLLARDTDVWHSPVRVADSAPVERGRSRDTAKRSDLAGWAGYGYRTSHSRSSRGPRPHLVTTCTACPSRSPLLIPRLTNGRSWSTCSPLSTRRKINRWFDLVMMWGCQRTKPRKSTVYFSAGPRDTQHRG